MKQTVTTENDRINFMASPPVMGEIYLATMAGVESGIRLGHQQNGADHFAGGFRPGEWRRFAREGISFDLHRGWMSGR